MVRFTSAELAAFALVFVIIAALAHGPGYRGHVRPIIERADKIASQMVKVLQHKVWIRSLNGRARSAKNNVKVLVVAADELQSYTVRDESERLRVATTRDAVAREVPGLTLAPGETSVPVRLAYRIPVDPNDQLNKLKAQYEAENPRATFPRWTVPPTIDVWRFSERVTVEAPLNDVGRFIAKLEAQPLFLQVTDLRITLPKLDASPSAPVKAVLEVSALGLPFEEPAEGN